VRCDHTKTARCAAEHYWGLFIRGSQSAQGTMALECTPPAIASDVLAKAIETMVRERRSLPNEFSIRVLGRHEYRFASEIWDEVARRSATTTEHGATGQKGSK
jgi:hypothetical protein